MSQKNKTIQNYSSWTGQGTSLLDGNIILTHDGSMRLHFDGQVRQEVTEMNADKVSGTDWTKLGRFGFVTSVVVFFLFYSFCGRVLTNLCVFAFHTHTHIMLSMSDSLGQSVRLSLWVFHFI